MGSARPARLRRVPAAIAALAAALIGGSPLARAEGPTPPIDHDKLLYELGVQMSGGIQTFDLSESEFKIVSQGLADGYHHKAQASDATAYEPQMQALRRARVEVMTQREKDAGSAYLAKMASTSGAIKTPSGLLYISRGGGSGPTPKANDIATSVAVGVDGELCGLVALITDHPFDGGTGLSVVEHHGLGVGDAPAIAGVGIDPDRGRQSTWVVAGYKYPLASLHAHHVGGSQI